MPTMTPQYSTVLFTDVWSSLEEFSDDFDDSPYGSMTSLFADKDDVLGITFYQLYAKYGNSPIANNDINQFKYKVFGIMFSFGPTWEKRLDIQAKVRALTESDILLGSKAIHNRAENPSTTPSTGSLDELTYINGQDTSTIKRSKLDAYGYLWDLLDTDVTTEYINRFRVCFKQFVRPEEPMLFVTEDEEESEE